MFIHRRRGWELTESQVTPQQFVSGRRALMAGAGGLLMAGTIPVGAEPNPKYPAGRPITPETGRDHLQQLLRIR